MALGSLLQRRLRACKDRAGNVSLLFALAAVPVIGCIGLGIDYSTAARTRMMLQNSLDVATLAAVANATSADDLEQLARKRLDAEFSRQGMTPSVTVSSDPQHGTVTALAKATTNSLFMRLLGTDSTTVSAGSTAIAGPGGAMDVAIAFDTTGSMAGSKIAAAQQAASDLVDLLFKKPGTSVPNPDMRVGLVPFTYYVNVGMQYRTATWMNVPADYTSTVTWNQTNYPQLPSPGVYVPASCTNDGIVSDCSYYDTNDYNQPPVVTVQTGPQSHTWWGCVGSQTDPADAHVEATVANPVPGFLDIGCPASLLRLGNDPVAIKTAIAGMSAGGETYIASGLLWGWRLLSDNPNAPFNDGRPAAIAKKRLILMTDGANTHSVTIATGDHENNDVADADAKTTQVCANIKAAGIEVYTIAFDVTDTTIKALLARCSSGPPFYYDAHTIADLQAAFTKIGSELTAPRLMR